MDRLTIARKLGQTGHALTTLAEILIVRDLNYEEKTALKQTLTYTEELIKEIAK